MLRKRVLLSFNAEIVDQFLPCVVDHPEGSPGHEAHRSFLPRGLSGLWEVRRPFSLLRIAFTNPKILLEPAYWTPDLPVPEAYQQEQDDGGDVLQGAGG